MIPKEQAPKWAEECEFGDFIAMRYDGHVDTYYECWSEQLEAFATLAYNQAIEDAAKVADANFGEHVVSAIMELKK